MKNNEFSVGSKIRVIDKSLWFYRLHGSIIEAHCDETGKDIGDKYLCRLKYRENSELKEWLLPSQICNIQKKFIDIEHIRENDVDLGNGVIRKGNVGAFVPGDIIQISEKTDGANASVAYNADDAKLEVFSRTNLLDGTDGLRGFKSFVETKFGHNGFSDCPEYVIFGEWCVGHSIKYAQEWYNTWKVYDIWNKNTRCYMTQAFVKQFCKDHGLEYIHVLYEGPFVSWDHCRTFLHCNTYGDRQEGIVVKNQSKLFDDSIRAPKYLKIVNEEFKESMSAGKKEKKEIDPETAKEMESARHIISSVVTEARVKKFIMKMVDAGKLQSDLKPSDMGTICKELPKGIYEDALKEEPEAMKSAGAYAGKFCSSLAIEHARKIVLGK